MKDIDTSRYTITESGNVIRSTCGGGRMTALEESEQLKQQIEKAKEIIKNLIDTLEVIDGEQIRVLKVVKEAEQFIKE